MSSVNNRLVIAVSDRYGRMRRMRVGHSRCTSGRSLARAKNKRLVSTAGGMNPLWSRDVKELFYRNDKGDLIAVEFTAGSPPIGRQRVLFSALPYISASPHRSYDVVRDGRFLMLRLVEDAALTIAPLVVVENFFEELRRKVPE